MSKRPTKARAKKRASRNAAPGRKRAVAMKRPAPIAAAPARSGRASRGAGAAQRAVPHADALTLPAECTLADAESLKLKLASLLKTVNSVTVDVSGVRRIDTASLQLIAAFTRDRRACELPVSVCGESPAFSEGARLLGLVRLFDAAHGGSSSDASACPGAV